MMNNSFKNKTILILGASSGIGQKTAVMLSELGATLVLNGRNLTKLNTTLGTLNGKNHLVIPADLASESDILDLNNQCPQLDGIVMSAGIIKAFPIKFIGEKQALAIWKTNYIGPVTLIGKLFRSKKIKENASLVFMSSISSQFPHKGGALYAGSKAAINAYSKTIALEYSHKQIRSNVISAAMVKTPLFDEAEKAISKEYMDKHESYYPLGFGEPEDIANAIIFLLGEGSRWITGTELVMDGGLTAGQ